MPSIFIIGYSGHAYVVIDILKSEGKKVEAYFENEEKTVNPFQLKYLGSEKSPDVTEKLKDYDYFIAIGNNNTRKKISQRLKNITQYLPINALHPSSVISPTVKLSHGIMVGANASINAFTEIGDGTICNSGCIVEHECHIMEFVHIAPAAVLAGNVVVEEQTFVGANSVIIQGIKIGKNVTIGAGTVVINDLPSNVTAVGNPARIISKKNDPTLRP